MAPFKIKNLKLYCICFMMRENKEPLEFMHGYYHYLLYTVLTSR